MTYHGEVAFFMDALISAGRILKPYIDDAQKRSDSARRKAAGEVVTEADREINSFLIERILAAFPEDAICAEEGSSHDDPHATRRWIIDPIDGTRSFVKGVPGFSVMLALAVDGVPVVSGVRDPVGGLTWLTLQGRGTEVWDDSRDYGMPAPDAPRKRSLLIWSPYADPERGEGLRRELKMDELVLTESFGLRAVDLLRNEVAVFASRPGSPHVWDTAAAWLIVHEAGGTMTDYDGKPLEYWRDGETLHPRGAVASRGIDHERVVAVIEKYLPAG